jgi:hypothetical protein
MPSIVYGNPASNWSRTIHFVESQMILAVPEPQNVQFGPRQFVMSTAMSSRVSCTPITEGAQC